MACVDRRRGDRCARGTLRGLLVVASPEMSDTDWTHCPMGRTQPWCSLSEVRCSWPGCCEPLRRFVTGLRHHRNSSVHVRARMLFVKEHPRFALEGGPHA